MKKIILFFLLICVFVSCYGTKKRIKQQSLETTQTSTTKPLQTVAKTRVVKVKTIAPPSSPKSENIIEDHKTKEDFDHSVLNELLSNHVSSTGKVDYTGFMADRKTLRSYINSLGNNMPTDSWTRESKLAYWINAYNAMTIDLILRNPGIKSIKDIKNPWSRRLWKLGTTWYNLDEIEHQILRKMNEPRIHFAIVCASVSCPKLQNKTFTALDLDNQLTKATREFLSDPTKNYLSYNKLELSKIFKWFSKDFNQDQTMIDFLNAYSDIEIWQKASIRYKNYDWNLND